MPPSAISPGMPDDAADVRIVLDARVQPALRAPAHEAFARIYQRHAPVVRALCRQHTFVESEIDDALQETFLRAFRLIHELHDPRGLRSWLYAIARHVCSERRRSSSRRSHHESSAAELARMNGHARHDRQHDQSPTAATAADREALANLSRAMDHLSDDERLALHLYYVDADPVASAAQALSLSRSSFYKLLAAARTKLAQHLQQHQPNSGGVSA